jgi:uncharacterized protein (TIGR02246 family)
MSHFKFSIKFSVLVRILLTALGITLAIPAASADADATAAIQALVGRFDQVSNTKDAKGFGALFSEEGEFTNPVGMSLKGRSAIEHFYASLLSESNRPSFAHMHLTVLGTTIRFIRPDVAAVDVKWEQTGAIAPDGKPWGTRKGVLNWVVTRENGNWLILVWHNLELPPYEHSFCRPD